MKNLSDADARLSVILAVDTLARGQATIDRFAAQTIANEIELVLVIEAPVDAPTRGQLERRFHSLTLVPIDSVVPLARARAKGVVAASAPFVFIAETHAYPDPDLAEKMLAKFGEGWSLVVPGFRNANPGSPLSWAGFLSDYGPWSATLASGETTRAPSHDTAFKRSVLMELGDRLENALTFGDELHVTMQARGQRAYFEPSAGIEHVNIRRMRGFIHERFITGVLIGEYRRKRWGLGRRLAYAAGSPLIPFVLFSRVRKGVNEAARRESLPTGTRAAIVAGMILKAFGEARGYLFGGSGPIEKAMTGYEVRKVAINEGEKA